MTCLSKKGAPIYYMTARVAFKKRKVVHERVVWIVSVFDNPNDIRQYDYKPASHSTANSAAADTEWEVEYFSD
jgi:hypothetical protein